MTTGNYDMPEFIAVRRRPLWGRLGLPASSMAGTAVARWAGFAHGGVAAVG